MKESYQMLRQIQSALQSAERMLGETEKQSVYFTEAKTNYEKAYLHSTGFTTKMIHGIFENNH